MRAENTINETLLTVVGVMIVVPVLVITGSLAVLMLATPLIMAATVVAFGTAILMLGRSLTSETPVTEPPALLTPRLAEEVPMCESTDLFPVMSSEGSEAKTVEMVGSLDSAPNEVVAASITKVFGPCPLGLMPGNTWKIGPDGNLSQPMCRPGATALSALFRLSEGDAMDRSASCDCLYAGREVTFTVRENQEDLAEKPG
jgi:hypothetical protein